MLKSKTASITFKVVVCYGILMLLILAFLGCLLFSYLQGQLAREQNRMIQASLSQIDLVFSQYVESAKEQSRVLFSSNNGQAVRMRTDVNETLVIRFLQEMHTTVSGNPSIHSIYILNRQNEAVLHISGTANYSVALDELLPQRLNQEQTGTRPFVWTVPGWLPDKNDVSLLCLYARDAHSSSGYYTGTVAVNLDLNWLSGSLFSASEQSDFTQFFIIDDRGTVIAHSEKRYYGEDWSQNNAVRKILQGDLLGHRESVDGISYEIDAVPSRESGFYIIARSNYQDRTKNITNVMVLIIVVILIAGSGTILASWLLSRKLFAPLRKMVKSMQSSDISGKLEEYRGDELQYMERYYNSISSYVEGLETKAHRDSIAKNLILGNDVQPLLYKWGILLPNTDYYAILAYMTEDVSKGRLEDYAARCSRISELIAMDLSRYGKCTWFELSFRRRLFLLPAPAQDAPDVRTLLHRVFDDFGESNFLVIARRSGPGAQPLSQLYREMNDLLKTKILLHPVPQILTDSPDTSAAAGQEGCENVLCRLKEGDKEGYMEAVSLMLACMTDVPWTVFSQDMEALVLSILAVHDSVKSLEGSPQTQRHWIRQQLETITNRDDLLDWLEQLFNRTNYELQSINSGNATGLMEKAAEYMQNHFGEPDLNANILARIMNLSPSYFGKTFKRFFGITVSEYLTKLRMERAYSLLLLEPEEDVIKIAASVGYNNAGYFATIFKKYYGVSPSKLRDYSVAKKDRP